MAIHAVQIQYVGHIIIRLFVHVYQTISDVRQIVDQNVLWIQIVQQRWLVDVINARARVMEHADQMLIARFSITKLIVFVMKDSQAIHTVDAVKSFYVSILPFVVVSVRISKKSLQMGLTSIYGFKFRIFKLNYLKSPSMKKNVSKCS